MELDRLKTCDSLAGMSEIRLCPDFPDHVLWLKEGGPISPENLPISKELCSLLHGWYGLWSRIWDDDSYKKDAIAKLDWGLLDIRGIELWKRLRRELSGKFEVSFYSHRFNESFDDPAEMEKLLRGDPNA